MMQESSSPLLLAKEIAKVFDHPQKIEILQRIDLEVFSGESVAITGRSGQGKSTLLQILGTLDNPSRGALTIAGQAVNRWTQARLRNQHIGFVFQSFHLLEEDTALENVLMPAKIARKSTYRGSTARNRALALLEEVGLVERANQIVKFMSGGEKQRIAIARAMGNDPDLIFADEPSGNLDRETAQAIHRLLLNFVQQGSKGLVLVTHDLALARLCTRHLHLENGILL